MKLDVVTSGAGLFAKLKLGFLSVVMGGRSAVPDIIPLLLYRPAYFGTSFNGYCERVLRGPSVWSVAEREVMATFVSRTNACSFCATIHGEVAQQALGSARAQVSEVLADVSTASVTPELKAMLVFLDKLTRTPGDVGLTDIGAVRAAGVTDEAIEDAIHISAIFSSINRIADSLGFVVPDDKATAASARVLLTRGYNI